jgi:hypothetical protein
MRDDVLIQLADRVMSDAGFRQRLRTDLGGALRADGFTLSDDELAAVRAFQQQTAGLSDQELTATLSDPAARRQFGTG